MRLLSFLPTPTEFQVLIASNCAPQVAMTNDFINIYSVLRPLAEASKISVKENFIINDEKLKKLRACSKTAIEYMQNPDQVAKKKENVKKATFKCKAGGSVSFPIGKKYKGRKKSLLNKRKFLNEETANLEEALPEKLRTRSFFKDVLQDNTVLSKLEMLNMHTEMTSKCIGFLSSPMLIKMTSKAVKRKSCEELIETDGVKGKKLARYSLSSNVFVHSSDSFENSAEVTREKNSYVINETPISGLRNEALLDVGGVKGKTFLERLSSNCNEVLKLNEFNSTSGSQEARFNSYLVSAEPVPRLEATFNISCPKSDQTANDCNMSGKYAHLGRPENGTSGSLYPGRNLIQDTTPLRPRTSNGSNEASTETERLSPSTSDTRIIKKKNITLYLNAKTTEHVKVTEKPIQEAVSMQLRKLRSRPFIVTEIKPIKKRTRMQSNREEIESKLKNKEETIKQKKLDLQVKAEERKQRREERMRKTKEAREKLEKERLEKVQNSGGRKRLRVDSNKETEVKKKMRTRQTTKQSTEKKIVAKVKASKKKRSSSVPDTRKQKPKRSLATVNETETDDDTSGASPKNSPKKGKPKNTKQTAKSKVVIQKNVAVDEVNSDKPIAKENISPKSILTDNAQSQQASTTFVCSTTFIAQTSPAAPSDLSTTLIQENHVAATKGTPIATSKGTPVVAKKGIPANKENPIAMFKQPAVTPLPALNKSLKSIPEHSDRQSSMANYDMTPYHDEDEDSNDDDDDLRKPVPNWASGIRLKAAIIKQAHDPPNTDKLFGPLKRNVNLTDIFGRNHRKYRKRTSSAVWQNISFNLEESMNKSSIMLT